MGSYPQTDGDKEDETPLEKKLPVHQLFQYFLLFILTRMSVSAGWALICMLGWSSVIKSSLSPLLCFSPFKPHCHHQVNPFSSWLSHPGPAAASVTERPPSYRNPLSTVSPPLTACLLCSAIHVCGFIWLESSSICHDYVHWITHLLWKRLLSVCGAPVSHCVLLKFLAVESEMSWWDR